MSNMGPYGGGGGGGASKNGPWSRTPAANANIQQQLLTQAAAAAAGINSMGGMLPFQQQQQQVFGGMGMQQQTNLLQMPPATAAVQQQQQQLFQQVSAVTYPNPRALNPAAFSTATQPPKAVGMQQGMQQQQQAAAGGQPNATQKVFTGTVTTVHDNFGFVDDDVFFQTSACVKGSNPIVGDRVLVEALYNPRMPFKWNATRIQVLPMAGGGGGGGAGGGSHNSNRNKNYNSISNNYNAVPPPSDSNGSFNRSRPKAAAGGRGRERSRDRDRDDDELERKKRREDRLREREKEDKKSPLRRNNRSRSPKSRRRARIVPRYVVQIPKIALDTSTADVLEVRRRYGNLYIPSDFFNSNFRWLDAFPADKPFTLNKPCSFHIMNKDVENFADNDAVLEPADADYLFSAKVMLMSVPGMDELYQKCCAMAEDKDRRDRDSEDKDYVHPTRLINFLVGLRGKNETMAIGGPWSPSLDGANPQTDPSVLIRTAIRTCKALTGVDLSNCTKWYRFVELYYRRGDADGRSHHRGAAASSTTPSAAAAGTTASSGGAAASTASSSSSSAGGAAAAAAGGASPAGGGSAPAPRVETVVVFLPDVWSCVPTRLEWDALAAGYRRQLERRLTKTAAGSSQELDDGEPQQGDEKEEEPSGDKTEPTHYSQLDPKSMSVGDLRKELKARSLNTSGLKSQLIAKLSKALKSEASKTEPSSDDKDSDRDDAIDDSKDTKTAASTEEKKIDDKERQLLEKKYTLPESQSIVVHPSKTAKSGKFDCTVMSLSLLLDYRPEDTKEHSFEVSLFAELFNEMLMRDFGFSIYRALYDLPEKPKDAEKKRDKDKDDKKDSKKEKNEKKDSVKSDHDSESDFDDDDDGKSRKDKDKKKRERPKMYTKERHLLLSFVYFDQTHCGYIFEKDIEELLYTLGLNLSRAQVRKLVGKVITRDSLHYRKLTDKVKEEDFIVIDDSEKDSNLEELAAGNKKLLRIFKADSGPEMVETSEVRSTTPEGFVMFRGALVDVGKLLAQLDRSEKARLDTEARMMDLKAENSKLSDKYQRANGTVKNLSVDLKDYKEKLKSTEDNLHKITVSSKLFHSTLLDIRDKIEPVLHSAKEEKEKSRAERDRDRKDESKSRWEKDYSHSNSNSTRESKTPNKDKDSKEKKEKEDKPVEKKEEKNVVETTTIKPEVKLEEVGFKPEVIDEVGDVEMEADVTVKVEADV